MEYFCFGNPGISPRLLVMRISAPGIPTLLIRTGFSQGTVNKEIILHLFEYSSFLSYVTNSWRFSHINTYSFYVEVKILRRQK